MIYSQKQITTLREESVGGYERIVQLVRQYDDDQPAKMITARQQHQLFGRVPNSMSDNVIKLILTSTASLLQFDAWEVSAPTVDQGGAPEDTATIEDDQREAHPVKVWLDDLYMRNQLRRHQYHVHRATLRDADHAVSLACRNNRVMLFREPYWDGNTGVWIGYNADGEYEVAVREWWERNWSTSKLTKRRNVYYPDMFQRFYRDGEAWRPITDPDHTTPLEAAIATDGSVPWVKAPGDPLGIPMVHFAYDSRGDSPYGRSDVAGLLGLQDDLNSMQHDISAAAKFTGFQQLWGKMLGLKGRLLQGPGVAHDFESPDAELHVIPAGNMDALTEAHAYKRKTIALDSETPMPSVDGAQWPTGEALLQFKQPQFNKAIRLGNSLGPSWTLVAHRAVEIANAFLGMDLDEDAPITTVFGDVRQLDDITIAKAQAEQARVMETISRIQDVALIRELDFLDPATIEALIRDRAASGPFDDNTAGEW